MDEIFGSSRFFSVLKLDLTFFMQTRYSRGEEVCMQKMYLSILNLMIAGGLRNVRFISVRVQDWFGFDREGFCSTLQIAWLSTILHISREL